MKVYTYFNNIGFEHQDELLSLWKLSWSNQGYQPIVLSQVDAENHLLYNEFKSKLLEFHIQIMSKPLSDYGLACWLRWLAYATQPEEKFYVCDYDVINHHFPISEPDDQLHLLNGCCPCAASGTSSQFGKMCQTLLSFTEENLKDVIKIVQQNQFIHFHDQEFLLITHFLNPILFKKTEERTKRFGFPGEGIFWEKELVHYSTASCRSYCQQQNINYNRHVRCEIVKRYLQKTN